MRDEYRQCNIRYFISPRPFPALFYKSKHFSSFQRNSMWPIGKGAGRKFLTATEEGCYFTVSDSGAPGRNVDVNLITIPCLSVEILSYIGSKRQSVRYIRRSSPAGINHSYKPLGRICLRALLQHGYVFTLYLREKYRYFQIHLCCCPAFSSCLSASTDGVDIKTLYILGNPPKCHPSCK